MADVEKLESRHQRLRNAFQGLDTPNDTLEGATRLQANQRMGKARAANIAFISSKFGLSPKDASRTYDSIRPEVSKQLYGTDEDPGDEGLYNLIASDFQRDDDVREESKRVAEWAYNKALTPL